MEQGTLPGWSSVCSQEGVGGCLLREDLLEESLVCGEAAGMEENRVWHFLTKCYPTEGNHQRRQSKQQLAFQSESLLGHSAVFEGSWLRGFFSEAVLVWFLGVPIWKSNIQLGSFYAKKNIGHKLMHE